MLRVQNFCPKPITCQGRFNWLLTNSYLSRNHPSLTIGCLGTILDPLLPTGSTFSSGTSNFSSNATVPGIILPLNYPQDKIVRPLFAANSGQESKYIALKVNIDLAYFQNPKPQSLSGAQRKTLYFLHLSTPITSKLGIYSLYFCSPNPTWLLN